MSPAAIVDRYFRSRFGRDPVPGDYFVAAGEPWPAWYQQGAPDLEEDAPCIDTVLTVWPDGRVLRYASCGAAEHQ